MRRLAMIKEIKNRGFDEYSPDNYPFVKAISQGKRVSYEEAISAFPEIEDILTERFWDDPDTDPEECVQDAIAEREIEFVFISHQGNTVGAYYEYGGLPTYLSPNGMPFSDIRPITATPQSFIDNALVSIEDASVGGSTPLFVSHGTSQEHAKDIAENGIDMNKCNKGNAGKAFFTSTDFSYANSYGVPGDGSTLLFRVSPMATIIRDTDPRYGDLEPYMGLDDFPEICQENGVDGIFIPSMNLIGFYNPGALECLGVVRSRELSLTSLVYNYSRQAAEHIIESTSISPQQLYMIIADEVKEKTGFEIDTQSLPNERLSLGSLLNAICDQTTSTLASQAPMENVAEQKESLTNIHRPGMK